MALRSQRAADAAFFEDWSEWSSLDGWPKAPRNSAGHEIVYGHRPPDHTARYYCSLRLGRGWIGCPHFEIAVPQREPIMTMCRKLPGARQHPGLNGSRGASLRRLRGTWYVPAEHWQAVRVALPAIKSEVSKWTATL